MGGRRTSLAHRPKVWVRFLAGVTTWEYHLVPNRLQPWNLFYRRGSGVHGLKPMALYEYGQRSIQGVVPQWFYPLKGLCLDLIHI